MSVILGYQAKNMIIMAEDNRLSKLDNILVSDESHKIIIINEHLAIFFPGNKAVQTMFQNYVNQLGNKESY